MNLIAFLLLIPAIACYTLSQLQQHGKLIWGKNDFNFWGTFSYKRKYKWDVYTKLNIDAPSTLYYRFFKIKYRERFPLSATALVFLTDGYHLMQFLMFIFLSLSITFAIGFDWWLLAGVWSGMHITHFLTYKLLQK